MNITKSVEGPVVKIAISGRLDTQTAPQLEEELKSILPDARDLTFDLKDLEYISSAGLRVLLMAQKKMDKQGTMKVTGANEMVMEVFDITGFSDILDIV